jgi:hypothetical protein
MIEKKIILPEKAPQVCCKLILHKHITSALDVAAATCFRYNPQPPSKALCQAGPVGM